MAGTPAQGDPQRLDPAWRFRAIDPASGRLSDIEFVSAAPDDVNTAAWRAWEAFHDLLDRSYNDRAALLDAIADELTRIGDDLVAMACDETGLGPARLVYERTRAISAFRQLAEQVRLGDWLRATIDPGQASRRPVPKPDLRRTLRPLGPVAVFSAGAYPLSGGAMGADVASALAAGCPVVVKGHSAHPGTDELAAMAIARAAEARRVHPGVYSMLHAGGQRAIPVGLELVGHPCVRAVGFTGHAASGRAIIAAASERADPVPVFASMESTNPVFLLPEALSSEAKTIGTRLAGAITNSNGQTCTCPRLIFAIRSDGAEVVLKKMMELINGAPPRTMLSPATRGAFGRRAEQIAGAAGVDLRAGSVQAGHRSGDEAGRFVPGTPIRASAALFRTTFDVYRRTPTLQEEIFGPAATLVICNNEDEMVQAAGSIQGGLTASLWAGPLDAHLAKSLQIVLEQRVGRLVYNGITTGVEASSAMVHGGPRPATNQPHATGVGVYAMERWCRPICYQNTPAPLLPPELRDDNPLSVRRLVGGEWTREPLTWRRSAA